jgi:hypothetical protein
MSHTPCVSGHTATFMNFNSNPGTEVEAAFRARPRLRTCSVCMASTCVCMAGTCVLAQVDGIAAPSKVEVG